MNTIRPCTVGEGEYPTVRGGPFPFTVEAVVTSNFGPRDRIPTAVGSSGLFHYGTDFAAGPTTPLVALTDGIVLVAESGHPEVGNWIRVDAGDGAKWDYYHMANPPVVGVGDTIRAGDVMGTAGSSGLSTGPHLHLGIIHSGINVDPLMMLRLADPVPLVGGEFYPEQGIRIIGDQSEAVAVALDALGRLSGAIGQQDGQFIALGGDAPAGYRDVVIRVKEV